LRNGNNQSLQFDFGKKLNVKEKIKPKKYINIKLVKIEKYLEKLNVQIKENKSKKNKA